MSMPVITFSVLYEYGTEIRQIDCVGKIWSIEDADYCAGNPNSWLYLPGIGGSISIPVRRIILVQEYV